MRLMWKLSCACLAAVLAASMPAGATTLVRAGLGDLAAANETVVVGTVLDVRSYWNDERTFILTDVRIAPSQVVKGRALGAETIVTLMGGTVDGVTTLIVGGAHLQPGRSYLLFLNHEDLPGAAGVLTVRDHCQGAFDLKGGGSRTLAVSQAAAHPLRPDARGNAVAPGGSEGLPLAAALEQVRQAAGREVAP